MADRIAKLDDAVIAGIAAGEVIERPASIVKELVENSLDAGGRRVEIAYDDRGAPRIVVTDDGRGIQGDELDLAVARHATSKIRSLGDLEGIETFGFRGEALASVAAVSKLEILSRVAAIDTGTCITIDHGRELERRPSAARPGTAVTVSELFRSVPARLKFLKTAGAEYGLAADVVRRFGLLRPDVHLRLVRNGKLAFDYAPVADLHARVRQIYGSEVAVAMSGVSARYRGLSLEGLVSGAGLSWGSARRMSLFVNRRWVHDRRLFRTVMDAYRTYLVKGRYPAVVLFLGVDGAQVDVNVHPAKHEVRFASPQVVEDFVVEAIREALRTSASPLGRWGIAAGELSRPAFRRPASDVPVYRWRTGLDSTKPLEDRDAAPAPPGYRPSDVIVNETAREEMVGEQQASFVGAAQRVGELEVLGQAFAGYILCQSPEELVLVDQHAAHERALFEKLMASIESRAVERQGLVVPLTVHVGEEAVESFTRLFAELDAFGWDVAAFGDAEVVVRTVPSMAVGSNVHALVERLAEELVRAGSAIAGRTLAEQVMASVACHSAIRLGTRLTVAAARALLQEAATVDFSACCPHGRPVARKLERAWIERLFGR